MIILSDRGPTDPMARSAAPPRLHVEEVVEGALHRVILTGELDVASCVDLEAAISSLCRKRVSWLVLDLSRVTFMDLCGLRMVLFARELCEWQQCEFGLVPGPGSVQRVLELTNLLDVAANPIQMAERCSVGPLQRS